MNAIAKTSRLGRLILIALISLVLAIPLTASGEGPSIDPNGLQGDSAEGPSIDPNG